MAASSATLHFSRGTAKMFEVMKKAGIASGGYSQKEAKRRNSVKISQAEITATEEHKKYCLARRQAKQRDEELRVSMERITYEAAAFDEMQLYRARKEKLNLSYLNRGILRGIQ